MPDDHFNRFVVEWRGIPTLNVEEGLRVVRLAVALGAELLDAHAGRDGRKRLLTAAVASEGEVGQATLRGPHLTGPASQRRVLGPGANADRKQDAGQ
ncbi:MAG: hypothetical protein GXY83_36950 [Rhodopirellula sp.]|nr:hypothetical protein [Rhodopirellula sp.]